MKESISLTAKEIAKLKKVGEKAIRKQALKEQWSFEEKTSRTGPQKYYYIDSLPEDIIILYNKEQLAASSTYRGQLAIRATEVPDIPHSHIVLAEYQKQHALYKYDLLKLYTERIKHAPYGQKVPARDSFIEAYNSGLLYPKLFEALGKMSWKTIEGWKLDLKSNKNDCFVLADQRGAWRRGMTSIGPEHEKILLACLLHPHNPRIAESIRFAREIMHERGIENGYSEATYRRWIKEWRERNNHIWTYTREGWKAWNDKCALSGERDYSMIEVGDVVVANGHTLNFDIINPWTGKPKRMTLLLWIDMKSSFPLGWEIMPSENTQAIAAALRWAIIRLGKIPKIAYLDNGKAFGARYFEGKNLDQEGFTCLFERLMMQVIHARPYRGQSKTIERVFGTFSELERWCPTFTGTSIDTKPPGMMRGEKLHRKIREQMVDGGISIESAHIAIANWFDRYIQRPQQDGHLKGITPLEVFEAGRGSGVDRDLLNDMMMAFDMKRIKRSSIKFNGHTYYHPDFHGRTHKVQIRYDFQDPSYIRVHELSGELICVADKYQELHPAAKYLGTEEDQQCLSDHCAEHKRQERAASSFANQFLKDEFLPAHRKQMAQIGCETLPGLPKNVKPLRPSIPVQIPEQLPEKTKMSDEEWQKFQDDAMQIPVVYEEKPVLDIDALLREANSNIMEEDAVSLRYRLEKLDEPSRYLEIMEMKIRGRMVPNRWMDFVHYFTFTQEYLNNIEKYEEKVAMLAVQWQTQDDEILKAGK